MLATLQTRAAKFPLHKVFTATLRMLCCSCLVLSCRGDAEIHWTGQQREPAGQRVERAVWPCMKTFKLLKQ